MALIKCPECGKEDVSDVAASCPKCGYNIKKHFDDINKAEKQKQNEIKRQKIIKSFKKIAIICTILIAFILTIHAISTGIINKTNNDLKSESYNLTRIGNFDDALAKAEKIEYDDNLKYVTKNDIILYSYISDCKRAMLEHSNSKFNRWFSEKGACSRHDIKFYNSDNYDGYPICIITASAILNNLSDDHYLLFTYSLDSKHYVVYDEISGLDDDNTDRYDIDNTIESLQQDIHAIGQNIFRAFIKNTINSYPEIETYFLHGLTKSDDENWKNAELLEPYDNYF